MPSPSNAVAGAFEDDDVIHVEGEVNPVRDLEIIHNELRLKDLEAVSNLVVCAFVDRRYDVDHDHRPPRTSSACSEMTRRPKRKWFVG
jgi:hypothetical protein